jgi:hypothetical protein
MDNFIWIINVESQKEFNRQTEEWLEFSETYNFKIKVFLNIHAKSETEIISSLSREMENQETASIGFESYNILSHSISQAIRLASEIVNEGGQIFNVSYANPPLVEIPKGQPFFMLKIDDFLVMEPEDIPFIISYADKNITIETLIYYLSGLQASLVLGDFDQDSSDSAIAGIRRAIILGQLLLHNKKSKVSEGEKI